MPSPAKSPSTAHGRSRSVGRTAKRRWLQYVLLFFTAALVVNALIGERGFTELMRARREHAALAQALHQLRTQNEALAEEVHRLKHDPLAIEEAARRDLGLARPGEVLFIVKDVPPRAKQR